MTSPSGLGAAVPAGTGLVWTSDYQTGTLGRFAVGNPGGLEAVLDVPSGDAVIQRLGGEAALLNRGRAGGLVLLDAALDVVREIALTGCNPYDALLVSDAQALVTCYDEAALRLVDLSGAKAPCGIYLDQFADASGPVPEMDHLARLGDRIWVTLALLDPNNFYAPTGPGRIIALDATTLALVDLDAGAAGVQGLELPCQNPFSEILVEGTDLVFACAGDYFTPSTFGIVRVDTLALSAAWEVDGATLGAAPVEIAGGPAGEIYALLYDAGTGVDGTMRALRVDGGIMELYAVPGFNLSGLAVDAAGAIYVGNRELDAAQTGIWTIGASDARQWTAALPPVGIVVF